MKLPSLPVMLKAFAEKDPAYDGIFFVAVKTTGVFCRPVCRAKPARPENLAFFPSAEAASRDGYRPCKLCRPTEAHAIPPAVQLLIQRIEQGNGDRLTEQSLREMKLDPSTARRQFKACFGMTFSQYQRRRRVGGALQDATRGASAVTAQMNAGFKSGSGFRSALAGLLDAPWAAARQARVLLADWIDTPLGTLLAIADEQAILRLDFCDEGRAERLLEETRREGSEAGGAVAIVPGKNPHLETLRRELDDYFAGQLQIFTVPLRPGGTEFELKSWDFLRTIPYGQTRSYAQQARGIGSPGAARAVGRANGRNPIGVVIPCHRVIGASGALTGYGGGLARKRWLLEHERKFAGEGTLFDRG